MHNCDSGPVCTIYCLFISCRGRGVLATSKQSSKIDKQACINVEPLMRLASGLCNKCKQGCITSYDMFCDTAVSLPVQLVFQIYCYCHIAHVQNIENSRNCKAVETVNCQKEEKL